MEDWEKWTKKELEKQMSPSRWNPKRSADEVIPQHISFSTDVTQNARQRIPHKLDISYGTSDKQKYDLYGTDLPENSPIVVWMHGGYWQEGSKDISATLAHNLYVNGVKTIVLGYTLAPKVTIRNIQTEIYNALGKVMQEHKESNFIVGGHSAGGQLAASLLHENLTKHEKIDQKRLSGFLLFAGVFDLCPLVPTYVNDALKLTRNEAELLSPLLQPFQLTNPDIPMLAVVGEFDSPEFQRQSKVYTAKLQTLYKNVQLVISPEDDHFTLVERLSCLDDDSSPARHVLKFLTSMKSIK